eukprot:TRINITY_DN6740_c0_g1_i5.p1 TRINITY_DN6740_c0_g1~~TRINITY_DN6740_c0_g1_i5.p1  ORF type:complete len:197 (-),score=64.93 TRINITY_DN6740_c0_g1_i5:251-841(-)
MKEMKMGWVPYIPENVAGLPVERVKNSKIFVLKCTQRRAALKQLKIDRVKAYEYVMPYIWIPKKEDDTVYDSSVSVMFPLSDDDTVPPLVQEFDWEVDTIQEFTDNLVEEGVLPEEQKNKFKEYLRSEVNAAKGKVREAKAKRRKLLEDMEPETKNAFQEMKLYKFYPVKTDDVPDFESFKEPYINRYYGRAHQVF